jgi:hypothetical protein
MENKMLKLDKQNECYEFILGLSARFLKSLDASAMIDARAHLRSFCLREMLEFYQCPLKVGYFR